MAPEKVRPPASRGALTQTATARGESYPTSATNGRQWARIPEWVAYKNLDAAAHRVLIILAAKAGPERIAWMSHRSIAERLGIHRTTAGRAIRKLERVGVVEVAGKVVVDREQGTWVKKYRICDTAPDQPEVHLERTSAQRPDQPEVHLERTSALETRGPEVHLDGPEVRPGRTHSVPQDSIPQRSTADLEEEPQRRTEAKRPIWKRNGFEDFRSWQEAGFPGRPDVWRSASMNGQVDTRVVQAEEGPIQARKAHREG